MPETLVQVDSVSKKFCRSLQRGMLYTAADVARDIAGLPGGRDKLRPGEFWSLDEVSFHLRRGECLGLIGANGAGKSTLLKLLNGIIRPDRGRIRMRGRVGALIEVGAGFHPMLTGRENIYVNGAILGMGRREIDRKLDQIIEFSGLETSVLDAPVKSYSSGMYVRLGFAVAVHCEPDVLLIDEVLAVGDARFQARCLNALGAIRERGATIILVSHHLNHISGWADRVLALDRGAVLCLDGPETAIQAYSDILARQESEEAARSGAGALREVTGTGRARITELRMLGPDGRELTEVRAGRPVTVVVEVECVEPLEDVELDLKLHGGRGLLLSGGSSRYGGGALRLPAGRSRILAEYPPVPVNGGILRPSAGLWRGGRAELLDWTDGAAVPVAGVAASEGELWWAPSYRVESDVVESDVVVKEGCCA